MFTHSWTHRSVPLEHSSTSNNTGQTILQYERIYLETSILGIYNELLLRTNAASAIDGESVSTLACAAIGPYGVDAVVFTQVVTGCALVDICSQGKKKEDKIQESAYPLKNGQLLENLSHSKL